MKPVRSLLQTAFMAVAFDASAQGTLIYLYDQQSSTDEASYPGTGAVVQEYAPLGQSFTPSLSAVGFIRLKFNDYWPGNHRGASLHVNLRTNSITGSVLGSSDTISLSDGFAGTVDFFFREEIPLTPGSVYFMEPVVESGDWWNIDVAPYRYLGGTTISRGQPLPGSDLWFREGIIIPEPAAALLLVLGGGIGLRAGRRRGAAAR